LTVLFQIWAETSEIEVRREITYRQPMALTMEQIIEEARGWPPEKVGELVGSLTDDLHASDLETEAAWKQEIDRRIEEIQSGKVKGIPGEEVSARMRKMIGR
jgi:putative addiction module component (TIGR02574 family)